jgi:hypothetical protein
VPTDVGEEILALSSFLWLSFDHFPRGTKYDEAEMEKMERHVHAVRPQHYHNPALMPFGCAGCVSFTCSEKNFVFGSVPAFVSHH